MRHCPTEAMIGDFYTKPLQGAQFRKLRAFVMNCPENPIPDELPEEETGKSRPPPTQECVGPDTKTAVETGSTKLKKVELPKIQRKHTNARGARVVRVGPAMQGHRRRHAARVLLREPVSE